MTRFYIVQQVDPSGNRFPFRVVETVNTLDGPRSRLTSVVYETIEEAKEKLNKLVLDRP